MANLQMSETAPFLRKISIFWQILMKRLLSSMPLKTQECKLKLYTVHVHDFSRKSSIGTYQNLEGCAAFKTVHCKIARKICLSLSHYICML